jgi:hypothetical protein
MEGVLYIDMSAFHDISFHKVLTIPNENLLVENSSQWTKESMGSVKRPSGSSFLFLANPENLKMHEETFKERRSIFEEASQRILIFLCA